MSVPEYMWCDSKSYPHNYYSKDVEQKPHGIRNS